MSRDDSGRELGEYSFIHMAWEIKPPAGPEAILALLCLTLTGLLVGLLCLEVLTYRNVQGAT